MRPFQWRGTLVEAVVVNRVAATANKCDERCLAEAALKERTNMGGAVWLGAAGMLVVR